LTHLILFSKKDPGTPYKAAMMSIVDPAQTMPELALDKDGFAQLVPAEGQAADYRVASDQVGRKYAETMQALKQGQAAPTNLFAAGAFTTGEGTEEKTAIDAAAQKRLKVQLEWSSLSTIANYAYQAKDGSSFSLFEARASVLFVNSAGNGGGACIIFTPTKAAAAQGIQPGIFRALAFTEIVMAGAVIPKAADKDKQVFVPALASGPSGINGPPCS
jgi:hypothetical protein